MDATREFTWGGGGGGSSAAGASDPARAVLVVGGGGVRGRLPQRGVYRALSGVTFQHLDLYVRQTSSCHDPALPSEDDEGLDSLESQTHTLTPSPDLAQRGHVQADNPPHAEGGYFSLERCLSDEDAANLHDSLENLMIQYQSPASNAGHPHFSANYPHPYQGYQHPQKPPSHAHFTRMPAYVNPSFQHQAPFVNPPPCHDYPAADPSYLPARTYPPSSGHYISESDYESMYHQRDGYPVLEDVSRGGAYERQVGDVYSSHGSYQTPETFQAKTNYLYPNYSPARHGGARESGGKDERKASVLSADSLEDLPQSPTSPVSPLPPMEGRKSSCYNDSLEDVRPRLVSELREFFERQKSVASNSSPESDSLQDRRPDAEKNSANTESVQPKEKISAEVQVDISSSVSSDKTEDADTNTTEEETVDTTQESSSDDPTKELLESQKETPPTSNLRLGDVAFLRATQDTPQTLLASTRLVQATLKPSPKATTFFISLESKFKVPEFEDTKKEEESDKKEEEESVATSFRDNSSYTSSDSKETQSSPNTYEDETDSCDPADYQESQLILRHFVADWENESPPSDHESDIDEFFLVLDSTGGQGNFNFPSDSSSVLSSVGSSLSDQKSDNHFQEQDSYDDGNLADVGEPDTSSSGLSPVAESTSTESNSPTPALPEPSDEKDGFLDAAPHNVIVKPFLGLGKGSAQESHAGSALGTENTTVAHPDSLGEEGHDSDEFETVIDTVLCDSDDSCHGSFDGNTNTLLTPELTNPPLADATDESAPASTPSSDIEASIETVRNFDAHCKCSPTSDAGEKCAGKRADRLTSDLIKADAPVMTGNDHNQSATLSGQGVADPIGPHYANSRDPRENEVTSGRSSAPGEASGTDADPHATTVAAAQLATCTFDFAAEDQPTPDLEALATLIAERIMSGTLPSTSASQSGPGGTTAHLAPGIHSATRSCDDLLVTRSVTVSTCEGTDGAPHLPLDTTSPPVVNIDSCESESDQRAAASMSGEVCDLQCAHALSQAENSVSETCSEDTSPAAVNESKGGMSEKESHKSCEMLSRSLCQDEHHIKEYSDNVVKEVIKDISRQVSKTSDIGDEIMTDTEEDCRSADQTAANSHANPASKSPATTPHFEAPRPVFPRKDSKGSTCDSIESRKTSFSSTITTPDDEFIDVSPSGDTPVRRYSNSSGISSLSETSARKLSFSSSMSDDWEWFPGRKKSMRGQALHEYKAAPTSPTELGENADVRKMSGASTASMQSSGISSMTGSACESSLSEGRKFSASSGVSCLSKIKEETRMVTDEDLAKLESYEQDKDVQTMKEKEFCHNITPDGKPLTLPPPVWPRGAVRQEVSESNKHPALVDPQSMNYADSKTENLEFLVKRAEILKNSNSKIRIEQQKLDLPLICPSSCPLRRKEYMSSDDLGHLHLHTSEQSDKEKRKSLNFVPKLIKPKPRSSLRSRRLTLHTFENIADQWRKQNGASNEAAEKSESAEILDDNEPPEGMEKEVEFRRNLVRDLERLEAEIDAEVLALESESMKGGSDSSSIAVVFDSNESVASGISSLCGRQSEVDNADETSSIYEADREIVESNISHAGAFSERKAKNMSLASKIDRVLPLDLDSDLNKSSNEVVLESGNFTPQSDSKSLPNLMEVGEAKILDDSTPEPRDPKDPKRESLKSCRSAETMLSVEEIVPCSNYEFSEVAFPSMIGYDELEEQEVIENFSDEDLVTDAEFEAFSETEHDTDMDNLNLDLFEPTAGSKVDGKMLSKRQRKLRKLKRKFSFNSNDKQPKDIKGTISSSLKRIKDAKHKIGRLVHKTLKTEVAPAVSSVESLEALASSQAANLRTTHLDFSNLHSKAPLERSDSHSSKASGSQHSETTQDGTESKASDPIAGVTRNASKSSEDSHFLGIWERRHQDGQESAYSWSDADSDFEYLAMEPPKTVVVYKEGCGADAPSTAAPSAHQLPADNKQQTAGSASQEDREVRLCHRPSNSVRSDKVPLATWEPFFCVLLQDEHTFTSYRSEEMAILVPGRRAGCPPPPPVPAGVGARSEIVVTSRRKHLSHLRDGEMFTQGQKLLIFFSPFFSRVKVFPLLVLYVVTLD
nr:uncharacterized protein LOC113822777 [Penaeus vannamei]